MHADEIDTDASLVRRLLAAQFPQWANLAIERVRSGGTDNAIYRLGDDLAVRLPRIERATAQADKEHLWLPRLAPHLPLAIPVPLAMGMPAEGYPWRWSVCRWLRGENAIVERIANLKDAALALAQFVAAMQRIDITGGPRPGPHNFGRGVPLAMRDARYPRRHRKAGRRARYRRGDRGMGRRPPRTCVERSASLDSRGPSCGKPAGRPRPAKRRHRLRRSGRGRSCMRLRGRVDAFLRSKVATHFARRFRSMTRAGREVAAGRCLPDSSRCRITCTPTL